MSNTNINDYLDEDPMIPSQQYFILSYVLPGPKNEIKAPIIKFRGAYRTTEECKARVNKLKAIDSMFNIFIVEAGKWGALLTDEEIAENKEIDVEYREEKLNEIFKGVAEQKEKSEQLQRETLEKRRKRSKEEGTVVFQDYLNFLNTLEDAMFVQNMNADQFDEYKKNIKDEFVDVYLEYCKLVRTSLSSEYEFYKENLENPEEIANLAKEITRTIKSYNKE